MVLTSYFFFHLNLQSKFDKWLVAQIISSLGVKNIINLRSRYLYGVGWSGILLDGQASQLLIFLMKNIPQSWLAVSAVYARV